VNGHLHASATLLAGKESPVLIGRKLGEPQSRSGLDGEEKLYLRRESNPGRPGRGLVTILASFYAMPCWHSSLVSVWWNSRCWVVSQTYLQG